MKKKNSQGSLFPPSNIKRKKYTIRRISSLFTYSLISEHSLTHNNWTSNFCLHFFPLCFLYCCFSMFVYVQNATTVHPRHTAQFFTHPMKMKLRRGYILAFLKMHNSLHCPLIQYQPIDCFIDQCCCSHALISKRAEGFPAWTEQLNLIKVRTVTKPHLLVCSWSLSCSIALESQGASLMARHSHSGISDGEQNSWFHQLR